MWPFRSREIVHVHRIEGLDELTSAVRELAAAGVDAAKVRVGWTRPELPPEAPARAASPHEVAFLAWLDAQGYGDVEKRHIHACFKIVTGTMQPAAGVTREVAAGTLRARGAPLP